MWTDSWLGRSEWQEKLQHAKVLRAEVNDAGKVFEMTPLSIDTFFVPNNYAVPRADGDNPFTGRVTCSASFETIDGRLLVAVGCEEGAWIGFRNDPKSLRKVLHVKAVTNIAILEEFGIFLILQDKVRVAVASTLTLDATCLPSGGIGTDRSLAPAQDHPPAPINKQGHRILLRWAVVREDLGGVHAEKRGKLCVPKSA